MNLIDYKFFISHMLIFFELMLKTWEQFDHSSLVIIDQSFQPREFKLQPLGRSENCRNEWHPLPFCVVHCSSSQDNPHSRSGTVQVINRQSLFIGGSSNYKHNDILRSVIMTRKIMSQDKKEEVGKDLLLLYTQFQFLDFLFGGESRIKAEQNKRFKKVLII